jgi:hypothetical protein
MDDVGGIEDRLALLNDQWGLPVVEHRRGQEADAGMTMYFVVPMKEIGGKGSGVLDGAKPGRETRPVLQGMELTMMNRVAPAAAPTIALTKVETRVLDLPFPDRSSNQRRPVTLGCYPTKVARLGGYLARAKAPPPGNALMWRGMSQLNDVELGFTIGARVVGN